ncbi:hypothetical protein BD779DRAFT_1809112 [Infundibulicybe gibba]|nr:hypothetical protein BD779DRAFT_1809112 [Infundibulicybe gibba]
MPLLSVDDFTTAAELLPPEIPPLFCKLEGPGYLAHVPPSLLPPLPPPPLLSVGCFLTVLREQAHMAPATHSATPFPSGPLSFTTTIIILPPTTHSIAIPLSQIFYRPAAPLLCKYHALTGQSAAATSLPHMWEGQSSQHHHLSSVAALARRAGLLHIRMHGLPH